MAAMTNINTICQDVPVNVPNVSVTRRFVYQTNVGYVLTLHGALNAGQVVLSALSIAVIAYYCQFFVDPLRNVGFICGHADTCFLVISCICLVVSFLLFSTCTASAQTSNLLSKTLFMPVSDLLLSFLYFSSSVALLDTVIRRNAPYSEKEYGFEGTIAAASIGLTNSILYAAGFGWFCFKKVKV